MGRLTPLEIREHEFKQSPLGYGKDQVHQFLDDIADELEALIRESNEIHVENKEARLTLATYMNVEDSLKETLLLAQKTAQDTLRSAQEEAQTIIRKATTEKEALLFSAKEDLSQVQNEITKLHAQRNSILIKLKNSLRTNLEVLEDEFSDKEVQNSQGLASNLNDERIVDFSMSDLVVEDLVQKEEPPEIIIEETEDFRTE